MHPVDILVVDDGIDGEIGLDVSVRTEGSDFGHVVEREITAAARAHIEAANAEIHGVGTCLDGGRQTFAAPDRSHYLKIFSFHNR